MKIYIKSNTDTQDWEDDLIVTDYFEDFIKANIKNPDFLAYGQRKDVRIEDIEDLWRELRTKHHLQDIHEIPIEDAVDIVKNSIQPSHLQGWFRGADSSYKPIIIEQVLARPDVLNAGLNIAYYNYCFYCKTHDITALPFNTWLYEPQVMYRGEYGQSLVKSDVFVSYTPDVDIANKFANYTNGSLHKIKIRPIDTWGSYQTNGEMEYLVPKSKYNR